ncbi:MAG: Asp-tRNA(Asn)/Glu-tRNA(Gln) amidotransferase subunit GatC [Pseudomonadota bacterium]
MSVDKDTVAQIARLARIRVSDQQQAALAGELSNILQWIEQLSELDTEGVKPMTSVVEMVAPEREDRIDDGNRAADILANAPEAAQGYFAVPKVVE